MSRMPCAEFSVFFFQAEDGIRDVAVTGVQTCALPISCTTSGGNHADRARNRRGTAACRRLHLRPDCGAAGYFGAHRDQPHQERVPQARRAFRRGSRHARGAAAPARARSIMTPADYVINLTLSVILIVGAYQFYFWCQRNHLSAARELGSRIDERIPYWPSWVWIYSCIYYPLILYLNFIVESPRHFTHIAMSYMLLLGLQMAFFVLFPVTTPPHWRAYNRQRSPSERFLALVQRFDARSNSFPSMHVSVAVLTAFHLQPQLGQLALAFPALIALSCLFTKQHYLLDLPAGALLGWLTYWGYALAAPA